MPKTKTILDELARALKARSNAINRVDRRTSNIYNVSGTGDAFMDALHAKDESQRLVRDLDDRAVMEYDRLMRSNPSRRDMQKAFRMMPGSIIREHDYFDR